MKKIFFIVLSLACISIVNAQAPNYTWSKKLAGSGSASYSSVRSTQVDPTGNVYIAGIFEGTVDFNPGSSIFNMSSSGEDDIYICKLDASGLFQWAKKVGGTDMSTVFDMKIDVSGNIYVVGTYDGTVDFNPSSSTFNLTSTGGADGYLLKLDANGNFVYAKTIGGWYEDDYIRSLHIDQSGNIFITGDFQGVADLDPGVAVSNYTASASAFKNMFVSKLDISGNLTWAKVIKGNATSIEIGVDPTGNVFVGGYYSGQVDFDPGTGNTNTSTNTLVGEGFYLKLDASGSFSWLKTLITSELSIVGGFAMDPSGNSYLCGNFAGTTDFNPSTSGSYSLTSVGIFEPTLLPFFFHW